MSEQTRNDVAVFIDFENVYVGVRDKLDANPNFEIIMERCNDFGRCILARAYADWYRYPRITSALYANNIEPMYVPTYYYDKDAGRTGRPIKNSADMNLCIDAMRTLFTMPALKTFVLVTGDRDFIPLVHAIRQHGKDVVIIGVGGAASSHLAQSADEFIFYEHLVGKTIATPAATPPSRRFSDIDEYERPREQRAAPVAKPERKVTETPASDDAVYALLASAILEARTRNMAGIGSLQLLMKELSNGEFRVQSVRDAQGRPIDKFKDFIKEAARRGKVVISTDGAANEVFLPGEDPRQLSRLTGTGDKTTDRKEPELAAPAVETAEQPRSEGNKSRRRRRRNESSDRESTPVELSTPQAQEVPAAVDMRIPAVHIPAVVAADEALETDTSSSDSTSGDTTVVTPFSDEERTLVKTMVAASDRPLSFQQIHDMLRDKRKRDDGIQRTNEELRTLIKIAINSGELQRIGRGNRVSYRVAGGAAAVVVTAPTPEEPRMVPTPEIEPTPVVDTAPKAVHDDGLDGITTSTPAARPRRTKPAPEAAKPARKQNPKETPRAATSVPVRKSATKQPASPSGTVAAAPAPVAPQIPSPADEAPAAKGKSPTPRRRKKITE